MHKEVVLFFRRKIFCLSIEKFPRGGGGGGLGVFTIDEQILSRKYINL